MARPALIARGVSVALLAATLTLPIACTHRDQVRSATTTTSSRPADEARTDADARTSDEEGKKDEVGERAPPAEELTASLGFDQQARANAAKSRVEQAVAEVEGDFGRGFPRCEIPPVAVIAAPAPQPALREAPPHPFDTEAYAHVAEAGFRRAADQPLSTFSIDVDTASYSNIRRFLETGTLPPAGAVRIEELLNYFRYDDRAPRGREPFAVTTEVAGSPWAPERRLVRIGLRGRSIDEADVPPRNLVFLVDVSGSMDSADKLPLVKEGLSLLADRIRPEDRVGIVVYAGAAGVVLEPTSDRAALLGALDRLQAGGSTDGASGIVAAYELASRNFRADGVNRVVLATDGDFNVGVTSHDELVRLVEQEREKGVFLTVLGFGTGNLKDTTMELLADRGNGNYAYVDSLEEARKVLVREAGATLVTIAKDVKIQVEWNPATVEAWRLVGYENRALAAEEFNDDGKDAGEIGAGHAVTALYEVIPKGGRVPSAGVDPLRYQETRLTTAGTGGELMTLKVRWKAPLGDRSELLEVAVRDAGLELAQSSDDFRFAASVAAFGLLLRGSEHAEGASWSQVVGLAGGAIGEDAHGDRAAFVEMARTAGRLAPRQVAVTQ